MDGLLLILIPNKKSPASHPPTLDVLKVISAAVRPPKSETPTFTVSDSPPNLIPEFHL
jgi:hypothetical protein